jgi:hypothetical protein
MFSKSLVVATTIFFASTAMSLPAGAQPGPGAQPNNEIRGTVAFWLLDRNSNGEIDKIEVEALSAVIFDAVDTDGNGTVSEEEFVAVIERHGAGPMRGERRGGHPRWQQRGDRHPEGRGPGPRHGKGDFAERRGERIMGFLGIDDDGLSKSDLVSVTSTLFERADADANGTVSQDEFKLTSRNVGRFAILE